MKDQWSVNVSEFKVTLSLIIANYKKFNIDYKLLAKKIYQQQILEDVPFQKKTLCEKLDRIKNQYFTTLQDNFFKILFEKDIETLKSIIIKEKKPVVDFAHLNDLGKVTIGILNKQFKAKVTNQPEIILTNTFPPPYDKIGTWDYMIADKEDEEKYGIKEGLYIHQDRQFPIYSEYLIIHEIVHYFVAQMKQNKTVKFRWIEEAIANWFAFIVHYSIHRNIDLIIYVKNANALYNQIFPYSSIAEYGYYDRAFEKVYRAGGHQGVIELCRDYFISPTNSKWARLFYSLSHHDFKPLKKYSKKSPIKKGFDILMSEMTIDTQILNLTSLEYLIIKELTRGNSVFSDIAEKLDTDVDTVQKGAKQLANRGYIFLENAHAKIIPNVLELFHSDLLKANFIWASGYANN